jgi:hypothetical protein
MKRLKRFMLVFPCALVLAGCAAGAGGGANPRYTRDFGRLLVPTLEERGSRCGRSTTGT